MPSEREDPGAVAQGLLTAATLGAMALAFISEPETYNVWVAYERKQHELRKRRRPDLKDMPPPPSRESLQISSAALYAIAQELTHPGTVVFIRRGSRGDTIISQT